MQENKRPTIIDVALAAQAGASTVSRYVRGGKSVSPRVAQRIEAAIAQLGYQFASFIDPPLTTVAQPAEQLAQLAVERLLHRIQERPGHTSPFALRYLAP